MHLLSKTIRLPILSFIFSCFPLVRTQVLLMFIFLASYDKRDPLVILLEICKTKQKIQSVKAAATTRNITDKSNNLLKAALTLLKDMYVLLREN